MYWQSPHLYIVYKDSIISTIVDGLSTNNQHPVYKDSIISTIVDQQCKAITNDSL